MTDIIQAAQSRVKSRVAVLQSLQASHDDAKLKEKRTAHRTNTAQDVCSSYPQSSWISNDDSSKMANFNTSSANSGITSTPGREKHSGEKRGLENVVDLLVSSIDDTSLKTTKFFKEALRGKALVVDNTKSHVTAASAKNRRKLNNKRQRLWISNKRAKTLHLCEPCLARSDCVAPQPIPESSNHQYTDSIDTNKHNNGSCASTKAMPVLRTKYNPKQQLQKEISIVKTLHEQWWTYAKSMVLNSNSDSQLQARLNSAELVGAHVYIIETAQDANGPTQHRSSISLHGATNDVVANECSSSSSLYSTLNFKQATHSVRKQKRSGKIGCNGVIIASTQHCYYIALDEYIPAENIDRVGNRTADTNQASNATAKDSAEIVDNKHTANHGNPSNSYVQIYKLLKDTAILAVVLPSRRPSTTNVPDRLRNCNKASRAQSRTLLSLARDDSSMRMCLLFGKAMFTPNVEAGGSNGNNNKQGRSWSSMNNRRKRL